MAVSAPHSVCVDVYGCRIQIGSSCAATLDAAQRWVFPSLPRLAEFAGEPDLRVQIEPGGTLRILGNRRELSPPAASGSSVLDLIRLLDEAVVSRIRFLLAVHAGCVLWRGLALLLPGGSHAGKSSLVAELLRRGATFFSDEYALVDGQGQVHPYPRPLLLRDGGSEQIPVLPPAPEASAALPPASIGWILALAYRPGGGWTVAPVPQSEAAMLLLRNTPHVWAERPDLPVVFGRAVASAQCWRGMRGEAGKAADRILALIGA